MMRMGFCGSSVRQMSLYTWKDYSTDMDHGRLGEVRELGMKWWTWDLVRAETLILLWSLWFNGH
jgi:hypothetical protein